MTFIILFNFSGFALYQTYFVVHQDYIAYNPSPFSSYFPDDFSGDFSASWVLRSRTGFKLFGF